MTDNQSCASSYFGSEYEPSVYTRDTTVSKSKQDKVKEQDDKKKVKAGVYTIKRRVDGRMKKIYYYIFIINHSYYYFLCCSVHLYLKFINY